MQLSIASNALQPPHASELPAAIVLSVVCVNVTDVMPLPGASRNLGESIVRLPSSKRIPESPPVPFPNVLLSAAAQPASAAATKNHRMCGWCPEAPPLTTIV